MTSPVLEIDRLCKFYRDIVAPDEVSLNVEQGNVVGLLGPNGAGKTTLVSIVCGLRRADEGRVVINGADAPAHPERVRRHIGLAPQDLGIYPMDTVRQNLALFGELTGLSSGSVLAGPNLVVGTIGVTHREFNYHVAFGIQSRTPQRLARFDCHVRVGALRAKVIDSNLFKPGSTWELWAKTKGVDDRSGKRPYVGG